MLRTLTAALVLSLLLVPALGRAGQPLHVAHSAAPGSSFSKSVNTPPDPIVIAPEFSVDAIETRALLQPIARFAPAADDLLPVTPALSDAESLRAPPVRSLA